MSEKATVGSWRDIGYEAPGSIASDKSSSATSVMGYTDGVTTWTAVPSVPLNDCAANTASAWVLTATPTNTGLTIAPSGVQNCTDLTPSWANLARTPAGS